MQVFAISDLHLTSSVNKPMDIFGTKWDNYWQIIKDDWQSKVKDDDLVLIGGDISWAMRLEEVITDLNEIDSLNGKKVIIRGNHDYFDLPFYKGEKNSKYKPDFYLKSGFDLVVKSIMLDGNILLSHAPCDLNSEVVMNIHGHFHNNPFENWEEPYRLMYKRDDRYRLLSIENENYYPILLENFVKRG
jgi:calcineurin-like phosphoesterase family protein